MEKEEGGGWKEKKTREFCQWTECTIKTGVTTKVSVDLTVNRVCGVQSGKGREGGEPLVRKRYFDILGC